MVWVCMVSDLLGSEANKAWLIGQQVLKNCSMLRWLFSCLFICFLASGISQLCN